MGGALRTIVQMELAKYAQTMPGTVDRGPLSNFEIGGDTLVTQYWGGTRHFFLLTL